ncbi:rolling circle replication-associated protein [Vibrio neptunius]|uniref:rolling circle replication-associated protein n=1 Tax=Vibrio neptunius TaxID=170651 RepID=UPI003CE56CF4
MNHLYEPQSERQITNLLSPQDVGFIAGVVQGTDRTNANAAAIDSGFFWSTKKRRPNLSLDAFEKEQRNHEERTKESAKLGREALAEREKGLGSSKGAKVRHGEKRKHIDRFITRGRRLKPRNKTFSTIGVNADSDLLNHTATSGGDWVGLKGQPNKTKYESERKSRAYLMKREWSNQIKMQMIYSPRPSDAPAANVGERYTEQLTSRAVRKIFESGAYVATCKEGFSTFLTLTFSAEQRERIFSGDVTLGSEVSRFLDGAKKLYQRGFTAEVRANNDDNRQRNITLCNELREVKGRGDEFHYIWVAECPANEDGEPNPHVHILLNWQVEKEVFQSWAKRIEQIWGNGFANLERIKHSQGAAAYIIKAVGYAAKGGNAEQGLIRGNRYNIARCSRAPSWDVLASFDADNMASIIKECGYKLERWRKPIERDLSRKRQKREEAIKALAIHKSNKSKSFSIQRLIKQLETEITEQKETLKSRGVFARSDNTFSICFEGEQAAEKMDKFLLWAAGARNWTMNSSDIDLSEVQEIAVLKYETEYQTFLLKRADWQSQLHQSIPDFDAEAYEYKQSVARELLEEYEHENRPTH